MSENIILSSIPMDQLELVISEAIQREFLKLTNQPQPDRTEFITRQETAQILNVSLVTLNEWTKNGTLQGYRIGSRIRYKKNEVLSSFEKVQQLKFRRAI